MAVLLVAVVNMVMPAVSVWMLLWPSDGRCLSESPEQSARVKVSPMVASQCVLADHALFTPWTDPVSGVTSYALQPVAGPYQKAKYFVEPSLGSAGYLWFHATYAQSWVV